MRYQDQPQLRGTIIRILNQRRRVYKMLIEEINKRLITLPSWQGDGSEADKIIEGYQERASSYVLRLRNIGKIRQQWDMIVRMNYWRHCLEIKNQEGALLTILPSKSGKHAAEREHILELIQHCKQVASIPAHKYNAQKSRQLCPAE